MALWGKKDTVYSTGTIDVDVSTGVCDRNTGSIAWETAGVAVGDVVTVGVNTCDGIVTGITSYTDQHGNQRVKTEVLVAGGGDGFITGDASDDTILPNS